MSTLAPDVTARSLEPYFIGRNDLINRWGNIKSSWGMLPGTVGFWSMANVQRSTGNVYDDSPQGRTLTFNSPTDFHIYNSFVPFANFNGGFLSRADETDLDILGTETIYSSAYRGLTMGGWFWSDTATANAGLMGKWTDSGNQKSYLLFRSTTSFAFAVSGDGSALQGPSGAGFSTLAWYFVVGRYIPGTSATIFVNGASTTDSSGIPASLFNGSAALQIGSYNAGTQDLDGRATLCFLSANALSDALIQGMYTQSKVLFGL